MTQAFEQPLSNFQASLCKTDSTAKLISLQAFEQGNIFKFKLFGESFAIPLIFD